MNLAFIATLFESCPHLEPQDIKLQQYLLQSGGLSDPANTSPSSTQFLKEERREERSIRVWINSLGLDKPVTNLYNAVRDPLLLLQVLE